jgi:hypothetical protein
MPTTFVTYSQVAFFCGGLSFYSLRPRRRFATALPVLGARVWVGSRVVVQCGVHAGQAAEL